MERIQNVYGVFNARLAMVGPHKCVITHRDPKNGRLWAEAIYDSDDFCRWVDPEEVKWL